MKKFNRWLNAIIVLTIFLVLVDATLMRSRHKNEGDTNYQMLVMICALIILTLFIWNLICKKQRRKNQSL